jgi:hypothetical protein
MSGRALSAAGGEFNMQKIRELLAAKAQIEATLQDAGIKLDPQARDAIGWALKSEVECDGRDVDAAVQHVLNRFKTAA